MARHRSTSIQLLISPQLLPEDLDAIRQAITPAERKRLQQELVDQIVLDALEFAAYPDNVQLRLRLLAWMIATGRVELKFALPIHVDSPGMFHEKIGLFDFAWGDQIAFTGSANESDHGHSKNYESLDVFRSWMPNDHERVTVKIRQFDEAWTDQAEGLVTLPLSPETLATVIRLAPHEDPLAVAAPSSHVVESAKWRHQDEAVKTFLTHERGILEMATGTGKTRTALRIFQELVKANAVSTLIIAADGNDLLDQWHTQLLAITRQLHTPFALIKHYQDHHQVEKFVLDPRRTILLISRPKLSKALRTMTGSQGATTLLVHDEVHRLGSPANRDMLAGRSDAIRFRLGLSATPEREYDDVGNVFVEKHIGPTLFQFDLADAIRRQILVPFNYSPLEYDLTDEDRVKLQNVWAKAAARKHSGNPMSQEDIWIELAKIHKTSPAKLPVFEQFIAAHPGLLEQCVIFVETKDYGQNVLEIVHRFRYDFHTYYAEEDAETLHRFGRGELKCLITCHRLSEGIDIRSLNNVILFSSARARLETIQRIGRCLRWNPDDPDKRAHVVDFVRRPHAETPDDDPTADDLRRAWLTELSAVQPGR